jgi:hypothetical protein
MRTKPIVAAAIALAVVVSTSVGCSSPIPNRVPTGEVFPTTTGESLERVEVEVPTAWLGSPTVVLVGYEQDAQFDADRWLYGLLAAELDVRIVELPTIPSAIASLFSGTIDEGMRGGIPPEDWASVVTVYGSAAAPITAFTGNEKNRNMRVLLLDGEGRVVWFHDEGYSAREQLDMEARLAELRGQ